MEIVGTEIEKKGAIFDERAMGTETWVHEIDKGIAQEIGSAVMAKWRGGRHKFVEKVNQAKGEL
jgi:hypothetical protein